MGWLRWAEPKRRARQLALAARRSGRRYTPVKERLAKRTLVAKSLLNGEPETVVRSDLQRLTTQLGQNRLCPLPFRDTPQGIEPNSTPGNELGRQPQHLWPIQAVKLADRNHQLLVCQAFGWRGREGTIRIVRRHDHANPAGIRNKNKPILDAMGLIAGKCPTQRLQSESQGRNVDRFSLAFRKRQRLLHKRKLPGSVATSESKKSFGEMKAGSRRQYHRIRRMVQTVREGAESGYMPNSSDSCPRTGCGSITRTASPAAPASCCRRS